MRCGVKNGVLRVVYASADDDHGLTRSGQPEVSGRTEAAADAVITIVER
jgi:hypothetical protein